MHTMTIYCIYLSSYIRSTLNQLGQFKSERVISSFENVAKPGSNV